MASPGKDFDLRTICDALGDIKTKWFGIGIQLGIPHSKLLEFKKEDDPLPAVIDYWLSGNVTKSVVPISWKSIVTALKSKYVGELALANEINKKYCQLQEDVKGEKANGTTGQKSSDAGKVEMDPNVKMDLEIILERNVEEIIEKYASYVKCILSLIKEKGISPEDVRSFLLTLSASNSQKLALLSDKKSELEGTNTINEIFDLLSTECASFMNYNIFQAIMKEYNITEDREELKYRDHLRAYCLKHTMSEFSKVNPLEEEKEGSKPLVLKFDIEMTCRLAKIVELKKVIAKILDLTSSTLHIVDVEEGCLTVTFLIPSSVADVLFSDDTVFTPQQEEEFKAASVQWMKCNGYTFNFREGTHTENPALKKLIEHLICPICLATSIKLLHCGLHVCCQQCLQGSVQQNQQGQLALTCPVCSCVAHVSASGVAGLQADVHKSSPEDASAPNLTPLESIEKALAQLYARYDEISDQRAAIEADIRSTIMPDTRKTELISQLHQLTQATLKSLAATKRDRIETIQAQLNRHLRSLRETNSDDETLKMQSAAVLQVKKLLQRIKFNPMEEADVILFDLVDIITQWKHGLVSAEPPDPSKCYIIRKGELKGKVGEKITCLLQTVDTSNQPCCVAVNSITCKLVSESEDDVLQGSVERRGESQYEISFQPTIPGNQQLHVKVEGQHIMGSPFPVHVWKPAEKLVITPIRIISGVKRPRGVAVNEGGEVVVTEGNRHCVTVFSSNGKKLRSFGLFSTDKNNFYNPEGVTVDNEGNIFVVDQIDHNIQKFTAQGQLIATVNIFDGDDYYPRGTAFNASSDGKVYVVSGSRVAILNSDLTSAFWKRGSGHKQFKRPEGIACDSTGNVYVAEWGSQPIQVFTAEGKFLRVIRPGVEHGGVDRDEQWRPMSLAVDSSGRVYVSTYDHYIDVFSAEGQLMKSFGSRGSKPGQFIRPHGLAVDSNGVCYVCDCLNNRIQLFQVF